MVFEIQVRTILQDAWATVEHKLGYKSEKPIPDELKREFSALAGLFHVADERFQFIADKMSVRASDIATRLTDQYRLALQHARHGNLATEDAHAVELKIKDLEGRSEAVLNRGTVKTLLRGIYSSERGHARNREYSLLVEDLEAADIDSLGALGHLLLAGDRTALDQEQSGKQLTDVAFARVALSAASPAFRSGTRREL